MVDTTDRIQAEPIDLSHRVDGAVMVYPEDFDAFVVSQPEAVKALTDHHRYMESYEEMKTKINELLMDIASWGSKRKDVSVIHWTPRTDDVLVTVIATNEDEDGDLHDSMADLDLSIFNKYPAFRLNFLLFRNSESGGRDSFVDKEDSRRISNASN